MANIKGAEKLLRDIEKKILNWNERSMFRLKGVGNLSRADLDSLELYAQTYIRSGGYGFPGLMEPRGSIKEVLDKYGVTSSHAYSFF